MPAKTRTVRRPSDYIGEQVRIARESHFTAEGKQWRQSDLVARLAELGFKGWRQSKVAKLENGEVKRIALEDVLALVAALGVRPEDLMVPRVGDIELSPKLKLDPLKFKRWLHGSEPLSPDDWRTYDSIRALMPEAEWRRFAEEMAENRRQFEAASKLDEQA
jgi:DNA-binding Xre family transcriptional regulator